MNVNRIPLEERYSVSKVRTIEGSSVLSHAHLWHSYFPSLGFYGVTYALGFRDEFVMDVSEIINWICTLELRVNANDDVAAQAVVNSIREAATSTTHMYAHIRFHRSHRLTYLSASLITTLSVTADWVQVSSSRDTTGLGRRSSKACTAESVWQYPPPLLPGIDLDISSSDHVPGN